MASWQAQVTVWFLKWRLKPRLRVALRAPCDVAALRRLFRMPQARVPTGVQITPGEVGGIAGEWVTADGSSGITLLYLHGGGYFACSAETHRPVTIAFARRGFGVFAPNYRLAPEHPFPAAVEDALAAYRGLLRSTSANSIVIAGESAGGGLAAALLVALKGGREPMPAAAALFSPWTDLAGTGDSLRTNARRCAMFDGSGEEAAMYLGRADPQDPLASPLYADLAHLPPLLIHVGKDEVLLDDSVRFRERARAADVDCSLKIWDVVPHAWQLMQMLPEARESVREAAEFLTSAVRKTVHA